MRAISSTVAMLLFIFCLTLGTTRAQQSASPSTSNQPTQTQARLVQVLTQFLTHTEEYETAFKNLTAEETKLIEVYNATGKLIRQRSIISDLVVYQSLRGDSEVTEYRNARVVDGKPIAKYEEKALKLLTAAAKANSLKKELEQINEENRKYEFDVHFSGFTIYQGRPFKKWGSLFQAQIIGQERIAGHDTVVLRYQQTGLIPGNKFRFPRPGEFAEQQALQRGRLWLDQRTCQLWREEKEWTIVHKAAQEPLVFSRQEMTYAPSSFGILTPQHFVFSLFSHFSHPRNEPPALLLSERMTYTYGDFKRFDVSGEESDKKTVPVKK